MRPGRLALLSLVGLSGLAFWLGPRLIASHLNPVLPVGADRIGGSAAELHQSLIVADLHTDALLWDRDLLGTREIGHVDLSRLVEGRVAMQVFTVVTKVPRGMNLEFNSDDSDLIGALAILQLWPPRTWHDLLARALHQADKLRRAAAESEGRLVLVTTRDELDTFVAARAPEEGRVAALLGLEGAHALEGDPANVDVLFEAGFRMIGLTHFFDNAVGGSAHGVQKGGLTGMGRRVLDRMESLGMVIDLAHASPALIADVMEVATRPVVVSHTGVRGTCPNARNLEDAAVEAIAATGGVIGIGLWPEAVCGETAADWARAVRHAVDLVGAAHVALGSDWDGAVPAIVDAAGTARLTAALLDVGLAPDQITGVMGGNTMRVLRAALPTGPAHRPRASSTPRPERHPR